MRRIEKTVFISYRRTDEPWALAVFGDLTRYGYDVFIDFEGIGGGNFETIILENIRARAHFLVLLTPTALERCGDPNDWMRREIEAALDSRRNIVPLMFAGFDFGAPAIASQLTGKLAALKEYNGLRVPEGFFAPAMERLRNKFLNVPVDAVLHSASDSAQQVAIEQKDKATRAADEQRKRDLIKQVRLWLIGGGAVVAALATLWVLAQVDIGSLISQLLFPTPARLHVSLLCTGGVRIEGDAQPTTNPDPVSITVDREAKRVNVFVEGKGSADGDIIEDDDSHVIFGRKSCYEPAQLPVAPGGPLPVCRAANGEISRHTGRADVRIRDGKGQTVVGWDKLECRQMSGKF